MNAELVQGGSRRIQGFRPFEAVHTQVILIHLSFYLFFLCHLLVININLKIYCDRYKIYIEGTAWSVSEKYILACDSMTLFVKPKYHDFFTRGLMPVQHYWPIRDDDKCRSIKFAVDWGNSHKKKVLLLCLFMFLFSIQVFYKLKPISRTLIFEKLFLHHKFCIIILSINTFWKYIF